MNFIDKEPNLPGLAKVQYQHGEFQIVVPGSFVLCAVTGQRIPLQDLRYWSVDRQEAYASAAIAQEQQEALAKRKRIG